MLTLAELVGPILAFIFVAIAHRLLSSDQAKVSKITEYPPKPIFLKSGKCEIYYTPAQQYYDNLISQVSKKLRLTDDAIHKLESQELAVIESTKSKSDHVFIIIFHSAANSKNLDYTIRVQQKVSSLDQEFAKTTNLYRETSQFTGQGSVYLDNGFIAIQEALDMSFVAFESQTLGKNFTEAKFQTREFPYPPHRKTDVMSDLTLILLPSCTWIAFIYIIPVVLKSIVEEKYTGIKELMKMVGVKTWMLWFCWLIHSVAIALISISLIVVLLKVKFGSEVAPIEYTQGTILFVFLLLYVCANTTVIFFMSTWSSRPVIAVLIAFVIWSVTFLGPQSLLMDNQFSFSAMISFMLLPHVAMIFAYRTIGHSEAGMIGVKWSNFHVVGQAKISMLHVFTMLFVDCFIYLFLALYLDAVHPGNYGMARSPFFPFQGWSKYFKRKKKNLGAAPSRSFILKDAERANMPKGIELKNLQKVYGKKPVVKNVTMDIYKNQITVLLGHNGAGKTTMMGMIAGMINKTSGRIIIDRVEVKSRADITKSLGLCPQENLFFTCLTVRQHLQFFATLKGQKKHESYEEIDMLLRRLNLTAKENTYAPKLSGGMRRKLSLGMALVGGSKILILDEPSSGMDPESRREVWDMLHKWRSEKTILITTHFMEEADALGDWIAIMNEGELVCFGTPMYLKKKYETGSNLVLLIRRDRNVKQAVQKIDGLLKGYFKTAKCTGINGNEVRFFLPPGNYIKMFEYLEPNKNQYDIDNISFTSTSLEDVFLSPKVTHQEEEEDDVQRDLESIERTHDATCCLMLGALLFKRFKFIYRNLVTYIFTAILAWLVVVMCILLVVYRKSPDFGGPSLKMTLSPYGDTTVYASSMQPSFGHIYKKLVTDQNSHVEIVQRVSQSIMNKVKQKDVLYLHHKMIVAAEFVVVTTAPQTETVTAIAMYNCYALHSAAISVNLISNTIAQNHLGQAYSITTRNFPMVIMSKSLYKLIADTHTAEIWLTLLPIAFLIFVGCLIFFPWAELSTNFAQTQFMCGVRPVFYWIITFIVDYIIYLLFALIAILMIIMSWPAYKGYNEFGAFFLIIALYGLSAIPFAYLYSRTKSFASAYARFLVVSICISMIVSIVLLMEKAKKKGWRTAGKVVNILSIIGCPQYGLAYFGYIYANRIKEIDEFTHANREKRSMLCSVNWNPCCRGPSRNCDKWKNCLNALHPKIWWMVLCAVIYIFLVLILDCYCTKRVLNWIKNLCSSHGRGRDVGSDTEAEKRDHNTLRVKHVKKYYWSKRVVNDVSLSVTKGQCMGILGVNGAGKTTTFRMITRETVMDEGAIRINAHDVKDIRFIKRLGYCPQQDALNFSLTGREILKTMALLRGIKGKKIIDQFLDIFGLTKLANIRCEHYSGGNKRRLTFAIAVIGFPDFILLDEPTSGVDPLSRRKFWTLIKQIRDTNQNSFILTSHSLAECEAVCDDLKILKAGTIKKEGPIAQLKTEVCGFNIMLKLDKDKVERRQGTFLKTIPELKKYLKEKFPGGVIRDEHSGLIHYYIKTKEKKWSLLFSAFEDLKQKCDLIEDYAISEASLEDVFLTVARTDYDKPQEEDVEGEEASDNSDSDDSTEDDDTEDDSSTEEEESTEEESTEEETSEEDTTEESTESESSS